MYSARSETSQKTSSSEEQQQQQFLSDPSRLNTGRGKGKYATQANKDHVAHLAFGGFSNGTPRRPLSVAAPGSPANGKQAPRRQLQRNFFKDNKRYIADMEAYKKAQEDVKKAAEDEEKNQPLWQLAKFRREKAVSTIRRLRERASLPPTLASAPKELLLSKSKTAPLVPYDLSGYQPRQPSKPSPPKGTHVYGGVGGQSRDFVKENLRAKRQAQFCRDSDAKNPNPYSKATGKQEATHIPGTIPKYLVRRKQELAYEEERRLKDNRDRRPYGRTMRKLPNNEKQELLEVLVTERDDLLGQVGRLKIGADSHSAKKHRHDLNRQVDSIDKAISVFQRPEVWVCDDETCDHTEHLNRCFDHHAEQIRKSHKPSLPTKKPLENERLTELARPKYSPPPSTTVKRPAVYSTRSVSSYATLSQGLPQPNDSVQTLLTMSP
eukprot:Clim_evm66s119 gene=Clim_evmTU66s119